MSDVKILGLDIGNSFTKTSEGIKIKSKVSTNYDSSFKRNVVQAVRNGEKFLVGDEDGVGFRDINKFEDENYITCLLTAIALSYPEEDNIDVKVVLGMPIEHYDNFKQRAIDGTLALKSQDINVNGIDVTINILDVLTYPQSAILGDKTEDEIFPSLIFDIGGGTTDISIWSVAIEGGQRKFIKEVGKSYDVGFDEALSKYRSILSTEHDIGLTEMEAIESLSKDVYNGIFGEVDLNPIRDKTIGGYVKTVYAQMKESAIPIAKCKSMHVIGGSTSVVIPYLIDKDYGFGIPNDRLIVGAHPQFTNARVFGALGKVHFSKDSTPSQKPTVDGGDE